VAEKTDLALENARKEADELCAKISAEINSVLDSAK
jgi:hypothetical protein